jgi:hypothetical protein
MKVALLVLGYREPLVLRAAVPVYRDAGFEIFLHLDSKADISQYSSMLGDLAAECQFIKRRFSIFWGGFSMVEAQLALIFATLEKGDYDRFCFVSDDTFPLLNGESLKNYFQNDYDWVSIRKLEESDPFLLRYKNFFFLDHQASSLLGRPIESAGIDDEFLCHISRIKELKKSGKRQIGIYYGSQWWSITRNSMSIILQRMEADPLLVESFRYSAVPDEMLFQSLIGNCVSHSNFRSGPMFVDWSKEPKPYIFKNDDKFLSVPLGFAFARKFSSKMPGAYEGLHKEL